MELRPILSAMLRNKTGAILVGAADRAHARGRRQCGLHHQPARGEDRPAAGHGHGQHLLRPELRLCRHLQPRRDDAGGPGADPRHTGCHRGLDHQRHSAVWRRSSTTYKVDTAESTADVPGNYYEVDEQGLEALGVKLVEGRSFSQRDPALRHGAAHFRFRAGGRDDARHGQGHVRHRRRRGRQTRLRQPRPVGDHRRRHRSHARRVGRAGTSYRR